jgi:hypothetical protein
MDPDGAAGRSGVMTISTSFRISRGALAGLRGCTLLGLCLGLAAGFLAEVWHGPAAPPAAQQTASAPAAPGASRS